MERENTNWCQSVTGVVIRDNQVLLARHTYGAGQGKLIVPGGYVNAGESPTDALIREYKEETNIIVEPKEIIGIRFNSRDWYIAFKADYISGNPKSDHDENSEVIWLDVDEALKRGDVPDLTKKLIESALNQNNGLTPKQYNGTAIHGPYKLYAK